ncbi:hypothetical protein P2C51_21210, partial [Xanthomonas perforans]
ISELSCTSFFFLKQRAPYNPLLVPVGWEVYKRDGERAWHRRNDGHAAHRWLRERVLELLVPETPAAPVAPPAARRTAGRGDLMLSVS